MPMEDSLAALWQSSTDRADDAGETEVRYADALGVERTERYAPMPLPLLSAKATAAENGGASARDDRLAALMGESTVGRRARGATEAEAAPLVSRADAQREADSVVKEKQLRKTATRAVVALFNAVAKHQHPDDFQDR